MLRFKLMNPKRIPCKIIRNHSSNPRYRNRKYNEDESNKYVQCKITLWLQSLGKSCTTKNFTWNNAFLRARDSKGYFEMLQANHLVQYRLFSLWPILNMWCSMMLMNNAELKFLCHRVSEMSWHNHLHHQRTCGESNSCFNSSILWYIVCIWIMKLQA